MKSHAYFIQKNKKMENHAYFVNDFAKIKKYCIENNKRYDIIELHSNPYKFQIYIEGITAQNHKEISKLLD